MSNKNKLTDDILNKIFDLAKEGYNCNEISKQTGFKRQTISYWKKKYKIDIQNYGPREGYIKYIKFLNILKKAIDENKKIKLNKTLKEINLHPSTAQSILKKHPEYRQVIRDKITAIKEDKILNIKNAEKRLPYGENSKIIGFKNGKYQIKTEDDYIYEKVSSKIHQGDPRNKSGTKKPLSKIKNELKELGYKYVNGYKDNIKKSLVAEHKKCGKTRENRLEAFFRQECSACSNKGVSKAELEILEWIQQWYPEAHSTRQIIGPKEIDVYIPSLSLGIEYCGLYWHNENSPQPRERNYHKNKMLECNKKEVRLITIFEDEWKNRSNQIKNFLKSVIGIYDRRIYARKCVIKEVDKKIAHNFLEKNHIQGKTTIKIAFGLYYNDELLGLITGNVHHRKSEQFTLNRLVFEDGVQIVGGASKLLKCLIKYTKEKGYSKIISWSDNRYSEGNVYKKCGFTMEEELFPDYSYVTPDLTRQSKQSNKKVKLLKKGALGDMSNTEKELAHTLGYSRIWDCGKKRWVIFLS